MYEQELNHYSGRIPYPTPPAGSAEHAAWTMVANVLLNLDEAVTKE